MILQPIDLPARAFHPRHVANLAAQLLKGTDYKDAVAKAHGLILEAYNQGQVVHCARNARDAQDLPGVPFKTAICEITGQPDATKAQPLYKQMFASQLMWGEPPIETRKNTGFSPNEVRLFRRVYLEMFPRRRPKEKKKSLGTAVKKKK